MVIQRFADQRHRAHERERLHEIAKLELAVQLAVLNRPARQLAQRVLERLRRQ
jgi:hypothetical protein